MEDDKANRHVTRRDGRLEGEPDVEPSGGVGRNLESMKDNQRDLTSLSGPIDVDEREDLAD